MLAALKPEHLPVLVIAPKQVAQHVWPAEVAKWRPELSVAAAIGTPDKRAAAIRSRADITVISRDNLQSLISTRGKAKYRTVVLDESQSFKTKTSARWKAARYLTKTVEHVWELTGTPAGNGLLDLWAQVFLLDRGERLGATLTAYRNRYFYPALVLPTGVVAKWELKPGAEESIHKALSDLCLHIPLTKLDLPDLVHNRVPVGLSPKVRALYEELKADSVVSLDLIGDAGYLSASSAGVLSAKLAQVTSGAVYGEDGESFTELHSEKLDALEDIVGQTSGGVLVFYRFKHEAKRILKRLPQATMVSAKGAIDDWNAGKIPVMLAHPASAGHGLNLQYGGSTIVWTSVSFGLEDWIQANGRLHRQGQAASRVMIHTLTSPGTIDEHILDVLEGKKTVQQALLDALR